MILSKDNLKPMAKNSGFKMDGYFVWCGSVIKEKETYYLFAARWSNQKTFPDGYMTDSEIVLAKTDDLSKPFQYVKTVISKRDEKYWDGGMAHNPFIMKADGKFVLFYIGTVGGSSEKRSIGYAVSDTVDGEYIRSDKPINLPPNANNPAVLRKDDGSYLLYFRDGKLKVSVAKADNYDGEFEVLKYDILPKGRVEDMFAYYEDGKIHLLAEDNEGKYTGVERAGVHMVSDNGVDFTEADPVMAYDFDVTYDTGEKITFQRRERPMILKDGSKTYLFTTAKYGGEDKLTGGTTWNTVQEIKL